MCNDRFKFRAYLKDTQKMVTTIFYDSTYGWQASDGSVQYTFPSEYAALMQCTGLKDKNDKLIFEGDIVRILHTGWKEDWIGAITLVQTNYNKFGYLLKRPDGGITHNILQKDRTVVIGNIYENPELMEQE